MWVSTLDGMKWWTWSTLQYDVVWSKYWTNDDELYTCMVATSWGQWNTCRFFWKLILVGFGIILALQRCPTTTMSHRSSLCSCIALDPPLPDGIDIAFIWWMLHWCEEFWLKCLCLLVAILTFWYDTIKLWLVHCICTIFLEEWIMFGWLLPILLSIVRY